MTRLLARLGALALALFLAACAAPPPAQPPMLREGVVEQITPTTIRSPAHTGVGAILGGIAGAGLGSLIGNGTGRDVAMVAGAVGGSLAGSAVANNSAQGMAGQEVFVRTQSGVLVEVTQPVVPGLRVGSRVVIQGFGADARVVPL